MAFVESLSPLFADFGVDATLAGQPVRGIFDSAYSESFGLIGGESPRFHCKSSDIAGVKQGDSITVAGQHYLVAEIKPDGTGLAFLVLEPA